MTTDTTTDPPDAGERIFGISIELENPGDHITKLEGDTGKQYIFQAIPGKRHIHRYDCGAVSDFDAIWRDIYGENDWNRKRVPYVLKAVFMTEAQAKENEERKLEAAAARGERNIKQ